MFKYLQKIITKKTKKKQTSNFKKNLWNLSKLDFLMTLRGIQINKKNGYTL